ncbi:hypothetical protein BC477_08300 [Clavibacter michiganensis subsp. michiganensis]|uniref:Uncharacterized protein n=1 Tax=Clavibacter michiganensis subsp. michiganensis TaxID=33013 RepID=A0A251XNE4_CLAMM|nr:hypothetical protein BC477_08300 [Clavibacter michiganensis subsp. michiganensis]OUE04723.1 hypothetical protein CMMCAS07_07230 [Clavibacter michiganensis subsp. michiganensis]
MFSRAKISTGGSIMMTATAITEPQSAAFCWKNVLRPMGRVYFVKSCRNRSAMR